MSKALAVDYFRQAALASDVALLAGPVGAGPFWLYVLEYDAVFYWVAGSAVAADGYRVLNHTGGAAGRWICADNVLTLSPRGVGLDDWPRLMAGCASMAYHGEVQMAAGAWRCDTAPPNGIANGTVLRGNTGVTIASTLPQTSPADFSNSVFYNSGNRDITLTTLNGAAARSSISVTLTSVAGIAVGTRILLKHGVAYWTQREVKAIAGNVVTLDRPLMRPYSNLDVVSVCTTARDIKIYGGGMTITGTGVAITQLTTARDCYVSDIKASVNMAFGHVWDVASRDCKTERCSVDCQNTMAGGYLLAFGAENIELVDCDTYRGGPAGAAALVYIASADSCRVVRGFHSTSTGLGVLFTRDDVSDTIGCQGCVIDSAVIVKCAAAGVDVEIGNSNFIVNCDTSFNQSGVSFGTNATNCGVIGGDARGNTTQAAGNSGIGNYVHGQSVQDFDSHAYECFAGDFAINDCNIIDTSTAAVVDAHFVVNSPNAIMRIDGCRASVNRNVQHFVRLTNASGRIYLTGNNRFIGNGANDFGVLCDAGVIRVDGLFVSGNGIGLCTNGGTIRVGPGVDVSGCTTPIGTLGTGQFNRGTFTLNGATGVDITFPDANVTDNLFITLQTRGGAPTGIVSWTRTAGNKFTVSGIAGDTSVYAYSIHP